jgi:hypothetical protein
VERQNEVCPLTNCVCRSSVLSRLKRAALKTHMPRPTKYCAAVVAY